jgi:hypothetical protein
MITSKTVHPNIKSCLWPGVSKWFEAMDDRGNLDEDYLMLPNNILIVAGKDEKGESTLTPDFLVKMGIDLMTQRRFQDAKDVFTSVILRACVGT